MDSGTYYVREVLIDGFIQTLPDDNLYKIVVNQSGEIYMMDTETAEDLLFGNDKIDGPGVRTPGFWQSELGQTFWNGDPSDDGIIPGTGNTEEKEGDEFAENDVIVMNYGEDGSGTEDTAYWDRVDNEGEVLLLIGDWNFDGVYQYTQDDDPSNDEEWYEDGPGDAELGVSATEALYALRGDGLDGVQSRGKDWGKTEMIERDLVAAWLNVMAGNDFTVDDVDGEDAQFWIDQAIAYLNALDGAGNSAKKSAWSSGIRYDSNNDGVIDNTDDLTESGSDIHSALDGWNNSGDLFGFNVAADGDDGQLAQFQAHFVCPRKSF